MTEKASKNAYLAKIWQKSSKIFPDKNKILVKKNRQKIFFS